MTKPRLTFFLVFSQFCLHFLLHIYELAPYVYHDETPMYSICHKVCIAISNHYMPCNQNVSFLIL